MALNIDFLGLADAVAIDPRGKLSVIGISPMVWVLDEIPGQAAPTLVLIATDDEQPAPLLVPGHLLAVQIQVTAESGSVVFLASQEMPLGPKRWSSLPSRFILTAQTPFPAEKAGDYTTRVTVTSPDGGVIATSYVTTRFAVAGGVE